jgi:glycosyltransferase involved in cell wall biosynthesis
MTRRRFESSSTGDDRVRVLFVHTKRRPPLGADTWIQLQILRELDRARVEVHAACAPGSARKPTPTYERLREIPDVEIVKVDLGREVVGAGLRSKVIAVLSLVPAAWSVLRLVWYIHRHRIDVIHTTDRPRDAVVCVLLSRLTRATCIVHVHVGFNPDWMRPSLQRAIRRADALVAISEFVAGTLRDGGCDPDRIHVVLNGIDLSRWSPGRDRATTRAAIGVDGTTPIVMTVCRLFRSKGVTELVQAMDDLRDDVPDALLLVVGQEMEAGYLDELRTMVRAAGLAERVRFLGLRDDVPALMAAADVFAMPSRWEPFGLVYAEAMAMALPVVALDNGGTVEVVDDGVTGLLSAPDDAPALAANLRTLLSDPARRTEFGRRGRERVEQRFTTRRMADDTADVYALVTPSRPGDPTARSGTLGSQQAAVGGPSGMGNQSVSDIDADQFAAALDRDGYVVIRGVVSKEHLAAFSDDLLSEFDRLVAEGLPFEGGGLLSGHLNCFPGERARFVYDELREQGIVDLVRSYRPDIVDSVRPTLNFNLPGSVAQHYHMDNAYLKEFLICNVAVVDTDLDNGAIDVLPGTNREFYRFWRYAIERKYRLTTRVPMQRGDLIVRKSTLWHRGTPNKSSRPRPMMAITFGEVEPGATDPFLTNDGEIEFYPNWFSTSRLGRLREKTFVRAPITYSTYRFVTSLYSDKGYASY